MNVTDTASIEVKRMLANNDREDWGVRVGVKGGGCSGLEYTMVFHENPEEGDKEFEVNGVKVFVDKKSLLYLNGLILDFSTDLMGGGFKFVNPNAKQTCSCGQSFNT